MIIKIKLKNINIHLILIDNNIEAILKKYKKQKNKLHKLKKDNKEILFQEEKEEYMINQNLTLI
jgi:hypothetical protein